MIKLTFRRLTDEEKHKLPLEDQEYLVVDILDKGEYLIDGTLYFNNGNYIYHIKFEGNFDDDIVDYTSLSRFNKTTMEMDRWLVDSGKTHSIIAEYTDQELINVINHIVDNCISLNKLLG